MVQHLTDPGLTLHRGNGIAGLAAMATARELVDHAFFDPPYSGHVHANGRRGHSTRTARDGDGGGRGIASPRILGFRPITAQEISDTMHLVSMVIRRWTGVFSDVESCHLWREAGERAGLEYVRTAFWSRLLGAPQFTGDRPAVAAEVITLFHRAAGRKRWNGGGKRGIYPARGSYDDPLLYEHAVAKTTGGEVRIHKAQKPLALMLDLLRDFTDPGELVCDPFAGAATTAVAARDLGRRFVGWELDQRTHAAAVRRLEGT